MKSGHLTKAGTSRSRNLRDQRSFKLFPPTLETRVHCHYWQWRSGSLSGFRNCQCAPATVVSSPKGHFLRLGKGEGEIKGEWRE